jgi:Bacterial type II and III secretion system protein
MKSDIRNCLALAAVMLLAGRVGAEEPQQVYIQVVIAEVDKACLETLGLSRPQASAVVLEPARYQDFLTARRSLGLAKVLAAPQLMAEAGKPSMFHVGSQVPMVVESENQNVKNVIMVPTGLGLKVTPTVAGENIKLSVEVDRSSVTKDYPYGGLVGSLKASTKQEPPDIFAVKNLKGVAFLDICSMENSVEVPQGKCGVLTWPTKDADARATLVCLTPSCIASPARVPARLQAVSFDPAILGTNNVTRATATQPAPAMPKPAVVPETWAFTAQDDQLIVHAEGGQQLGVKHLIAPLNLSDVRFTAAKGRVLISATLFRVEADRVMLDRSSGKLTLKGNVQFSSDDRQIEVRGTEVILDLATGTLHVTGAASLRNATRN